jgi:hypothetical protein
MATFKRAAVALIVMVGLMLPMTACGETPNSSSSSTSAVSEKREARQRERFIQQMCDTNEGGYYHVDPECAAGYGG